MAKQRVLDEMYMKMAYDAANVSYAKRRKVGAILVVPDGGRFEGINGMPSGFDNCCENEVTTVETTAKKSDQILSIINKPVRQLVTKPECLHAESNAIAKIARSTTSSIGGTMYCTLSPCLECAKLIIQVGIVRVVYSEQYPYPGHSGTVRAMGLELLREAGIQVDKLSLTGQNTHEKDLVPNDEGYINYDEELWHGRGNP